MLIVESLKESIMFGKYKIEVKCRKLYINNVRMDVYGYDILGIIGDGANAFVVKAHNIYMDRDCAIKIWIKYAQKGRSQIARSREEIRKIAQFKHENIVEVYNSFKRDDKICLVMEYVAGSTIREYLQRHPSMSARYTLLMKLLAGLRHAHEKGYLHGDLHTNNILVTRDNNIKILDFGTSFFNGRESSEEQESRLIKETCLTIIGVQNAKMLNESISSLTPFNTRILMKALAKVSALVDFTRSYDRVINDSILYDIARFCTLIPCFDLRELINQLYRDKQFINDSNGSFNDDIIKNFVMFLKNLYTFIVDRIIQLKVNDNSNMTIDNYVNEIQEIIERSKKDLNYSFDSFVKNINHVFFKYSELQQLYINRYNKKGILLEEIDIYTNEGDMEMFNSSLYSEVFEDNSKVIMRERLNYFERLETSYRIG